MYSIQKGKETMTAKERVKSTFLYEKTDRVTIGYDANPAVHERLKKALGIDGCSDETLLQILGVDYRPVQAPYTGPELFSVPANRRVDQLEGSIMRWVAHETGGYWDFCDFPLKDAWEEAFEKFPVPDPDCFDYQAASDLAKSYDNQFALFTGHAGMPDIINSNGRIMGVEDILCHLLEKGEAAMSLILRRAEFQLKMLDRLLHACKGQIDFLWLGEDLGTQIGPMISLELYREVLKPIHKQFADLADSYHIPSLIHTCGSSSWVYEDFIEIGIKGVDTLQPEAVHMSPQYLKEHFGGRLNFRGCISTAGPLAYGSCQDVTDVCKETLDIMMECRGYHFAPTHAIQDNTPVENIIAMYQAAHDYGYYK